MRWLRPEALEALEGVSPWGLLTAGVLVGAAGLPAVRKGLRGLAVGAVKGVLAVSAGVQEMAEKTSRGWSELVTEARQEREQKEQKAAEWPEKVRRAEVGAVKKGLEVSEKIKGAVESVKEKVGDLVEEAKKEITGAAAVGAAADTYTETQSNHPARGKTPKSARDNPPGKDEEI